MIRPRLSRLAAATSAAALGAVLLLVPAASASAAVPTTIEFETTGPVEVVFGEQWSLTLAVSTTYDSGPTLRLGPNDGTVDVYLSGVGGAFASSLPIQPDGLVYVSQPSSQPLLAAGDYDVTAIYNPAPGGYYGSSQTATALVLTVSALDVTPEVSIAVDPSVSDSPVITAALSGSYIDSTNGYPAGTWQFTLAGPGGAPAFDATVAQPQGATNPLRITVDSALDRGTTYTLSSTFTPADAIAGGVTVGSAPDAVYETPSGTFGEAITSAVPLPLWLAIVMLALLLGLGAAAIVIGVMLAKRAPTAPQDAAPSRRVPGDPPTVEFASLDEFGLPEPETIPELLPEGQVRRNPTSTTWLLSDVEPATNLPNASEAPTERLDAVKPNEVASPSDVNETEIIDAKAADPGAESGETEGPKDS